MEPYKRLGLRYNIRQVHFHSPESKSFLRMHKKEQFGDSLVDIRKSVVYVNKNLKPFYGFEEGVLYNGYRYVFPVIDSVGEHLGSVEVSFDLKNFVDNYMKNYDTKKLISL